MSSHSSHEEGIDKIADQSGIELLPLGNAAEDDNDNKSDVGSYHSGTLSTQSHDTVDAGGRVGGVRVKKPRMELTQAVKVGNETVVDEWIAYLGVHPVDAWGDKLIDECDYNDDTYEDMNPVHIAVLRNKVKILEKLAKAGADLECPTEDDAENPPLVLAARQLPKNLFEEEHTKEQSPDRADEAEKRFSKAPVARTKSKVDEGGRDRVQTVSKDAKVQKKAKVEKITVEKDETGKIDTTFHVLLRHNVDVNNQNEAGITALHAACDRGITAMVKELLINEKIDINKKDHNKNTPLHAACIGGEKDVVFQLIEKGADIAAQNNEEMTPLLVAVAERKLEIVKTIIDMRAEDKEELLRQTEKGGHTPFLLAVKSEAEDIIKFLLETGAPVTDQNENGANAFHLAASLNKVSILQMIYDSPDGEDLLDEEDWNDRTPLHFAAKHNQVDAIEFLVEKDAEMEWDDYNGRTPLLTAAAAGQADAVIKLIELGADVEAVDSDNNNIVQFIVEKGRVDMLKVVIASDAGRDLCSVEDRNGNTPLHSSCAKGDVELVKIFLDSEVPIDERNEEDQTPLHLACKGGHYEAANVLLKKGARVTIKDDNSSTPLHHATSGGHLDIVKLLIDKQADIDAIDDTGTPLACAAENGHEVIVDYLLKSGADVDGKFTEGDNDELVTTPLIAASQNGHVRIVKRLLKSNADVTLEEYYSDLNCLGEAVLKGNSDCALAIVQSDQWEDAMRLCTPCENYTPMRLLVQNMPEVATVVLNRCITDNKSKDCTEKDDDYTVTYNYEFLEDYQEKDELIPGWWDDDDDYDDTTNTRRRRDDDDVDGEKKKPPKKKKSKPFKWGPKGFKKQHHPLQVMVESQRIELLKHPIVTKLLDHKWKSFGRNFYFVNMFTYLIFLSFLTAFALLSPTPNSHDCIADFRCTLVNGKDCVEDLPIMAMMNISNGERVNISGTYYRTCQAVVTKTTTNINGSVSSEILDEECFGILVDFTDSDDDDSCDDTEDYERSFLRGAAIIVVIFAVIRILIEAIQIVRRRFRYFSDWENWMELCLFVATIIFVSSGLQSGCLCPDSWQWQLGALALFIAWLDLVLFLKKFPLTGIYVVMFVDIFYTFMRMILLSILFVVSFGVAFYMLFFRPGVRSAFSSPGRSLVKTMVMTTGEFDFDGIFFNSQEDAEDDNDLFYPQIAYILWIVFIILMPIILTNLLVGLAVDDIKGVQETATLKRLALQVDLALDVEDLMFIRVRKHFRKKKDDERPNDDHDSVWYKIKKVFFPAEDSGKKSKIGDLRPPLSPIEQVQVETAQHGEELFRLRALIKDIAKKQEIMDQKQDLILEYLKPKSAKPGDVESVSSVTQYDVSKQPADDTTPGSTGGQYKLKSRSSSSSDDEDDDDYDDDKDDRDDDDDDDDDD